MDILRKELNSIYEAQCLDCETLDSAEICGAKAEAEVIAAATGGCTVVTDASCDRCYIYARNMGALLGLSCGPDFFAEAGSGDEDIIYERIHPEDLVEKRMLEYEFFKLVDAQPSGVKRDYKATCRLRIKDSRGEYRAVDNSTQILRLSPRGRIWLILCCYSLSSSAQDVYGISPHIVNTRSGEILLLSLATRRARILTRREKEVLKLISEGKASKHIADRLGISIHTVNRHRQNIIEKLSVGSCVEAIAAATAMKLM
ncbi:MAG: response regulator transcription factor [Muribaculaceae bacterium]